MIGCAPMKCSAHYAITDYYNAVIKFFLNLDL